MLQSRWPPLPNTRTVRRSRSTARRSELDAESRSSRAAGLFRVVVHSGRHRLTAPMGGQCVRYLLCGLFPAAQGRPPLSCGGPQPVPVALVTQPVSERSGEGGGIVGRDQLAGAGAIGGGAERFGQPTDGGGYDGQAT